MNRTISIVVPVYNKESYLEECIASIQKQTYPEIELWLVDDGSTDGSTALCQRFCRNDERIHFIHQENQGQNAARRAGVEAAQGEWLVFVDADDYVAPEMCSLLMQNMMETHADFVSCAHQSVVDGRMGNISNQCPGIYHGKEILRTFFTDRDSIRIPERGKRSASTSLCATLFRTETIREELRSFDMRIRLSEDTACLFSMLLKAERVSYIPEALYFYRQVENSVSHQHDRKYIQLIRYVGQFLKQRFCEEGMTEEDESVIDATELSLLTFFGMEYFDDYPGIFPFMEELPEGGIAFYGAGHFGEEFYAKEYDRLAAVGWFDRDYERYQKLGRDVRNPAELKQEDFDIILVTIQRPSTAREVAATLRGRFPGKHIETMSDEILNSSYTRKKLKDLRESNENPCHVSSAVPPCARK